MHRHSQFVPKKQEQSATEINLKNLHNSSIFLPFIVKNIPLKRKYRRSPVIRAQILRIIEKYPRP